MFVCLSISLHGRIEMTYGLRIVANCGLKHWGRSLTGARIVLSTSDLIQLLRFREDRRFHRIFPHFASSEQRRILWRKFRIRIRGRIEMTYGLRIIMELREIALTVARTDVRTLHLIQLLRLHKVFPHFIISPGILRRRFRVHIHGRKGSTNRLRIMMKLRERVTMTDVSTSDWHDAALAISGKFV